MKYKASILFCGKDKRFDAAAACFENDGYECKRCFCDKNDCIIRETNYVVLPVPSFIDDIRLNTVNYISPEHLFAGLCNKTHVFGCKLSDFILRTADEYNINAYDFGEREDFNLMNAIPTAEAAIIIAAERLGKTVYGSDFTVIGYGRIGKALARRLLSLGGSVTVVSRSLSSLVKAECDGCKAAEMSSFLSQTVMTDVCFNTVPCRIIGNAAVSDSSCELFIDLASKPGGFSEEAETILGQKLIKALALPGKYFPKSAGEIIYKTVKSMINEIGG